MKGVGALRVTLAAMLGAPDGSIWTWKANYMKRSCNKRQLRVCLLAIRHKCRPFFVMFRETRDVATGMLTEDRGHLTGVADRCSQFSYAFLYTQIPMNNI